MSYLTEASYNATDVSVPFKVLDSTAGTPETGYAYNTTGVDFWYRRGPTGTKTSITEATQTVTGAHTDGGLVHVSDGVGRLDLPDAAVATGVDYVEYGGTFTDMVVIGGRVKLESLAQYATRLLTETLFPASPVVSTTTGNTTGRINLTDVVDAQTADADLVGSKWLVWDATNGQTVEVTATSVVSARLFAVETSAAGDAMDFTVAAGDMLFFGGFGTVHRILSVENGSALTEAGGTGDHLSAVPWNSAWDAEVQSEAQDAITATFGSQTQGDLAALVATVDTVVDGIQTDLSNGTDGLGAIKTDTAAIKAKTDDLTFTKANELDTNPQSINGATLTGDGTSGTEWGPA